MKKHTLHDKLESSARRGFMKSTGALSGALVIGFNLPSASAQSSAPMLTNAWVKIDNKGAVTLICHRSEMGQGVYTSMPMLVAEELDVALSSVTIEMAPLAPVYINAMLGMSEVPVIDITFVSSSAAPGGLGEVGVPLIMPAIANAVATLTGKRVRKLPLMGAFA